MGTCLYYNFFFSFPVFYVKKHERGWWGGADGKATKAQKENPMREKRNRKEGLMCALCNVRPEQRREAKHSILKLWLMDATCEFEWYVRIR